jgi:glycosyltransferase involved in cell wall biosynthesis
MRVAHVINTLGLGGVPVVVEGLLGHLPGDRYESFVYTLSSPTDNTEHRAALAGRLGDLATLRQPTRDAKKFHVVAELAEWVLADRIDVLHTHSYKPNMYGRLAGVLAGVPMVAHYHNFYDANWATDGSLIYDRGLAPKTAAFIACSAAVKAHVVERVGLAPDAVQVIANAVDVERFARGGDTASLRRELNIPADAPLILALVGTEDAPGHQAALERMAGELGVAQSVRFTGYVSDMPTLYAAGDVLALASHWEGFGLVLAEAMAAGTPIVATRVGAIPEVVGEDGAAMLVPVAEPVALAQSLIAVLTEPERRSAMSAAGRLRAQHFTWGRAAGELDALYRGLQ